MAIDRLKRSIGPDGGITIATDLADDNHDWKVSEIGEKQKEVNGSLKNNVNRQTN